MEFERQSIKSISVTDFLCFRSLCKFSENIFFHSCILTEVSKVPSDPVLFSPFFESLLIGIYNCDKERLEAISIYPYLEHKTSRQNINVYQREKIDCIKPYFLFECNLLSITKTSHLAIH